MLSISIEKSDRDFGSRIPLGYGIAWHNPECRTTTLILLPLNWPAAFIRECYFRLLQGPRNRLRELLIAELSEDEAKGFNLGYQDGVKHGEEAGLRRMKIFIDAVEKHA